jgi:Fe-S cluster assembly protein SufD
MFEKRIVVKTNKKLNLDIKKENKIVIYLQDANLDINLNHNSNSSCDIYVNISSKNKDSNLVLNSIVKNDSKNITLHQYINGILLTDKSKINVKPSLLINTNSIDCSHEIKIGCLSKEKMFYLQSKNISPINAKKILLSNFFNI